MSDNDEILRRRRRVKRLKCYLVVIFLVLTITPLVMSVITLVNMQKLQKDIENLTDRFNEYENAQLLKAEAESARIQELENQVEILAEEPAEVQEEEIVQETVGRKVYLTFDDGPSSNTTEILDVLDSYNVKATFFVTGAQAEKHPEWYKEIVDRGHSIGMHSYTHIYGEIYKDTESFITDIDSIHELIETTTGVDCRLYRFPGGSSNAVSSVPMSELCGLVTSRGWKYFDWNVSSQDASSVSRSSAEITNNVLRGVEKYENNVVLMHDAADKHTTVEALPAIIEKIMAMDDTEILPLDETSEEVQHISALE